MLFCFIIFMNKVVNGRLAEIIHDIEPLTTFRNRWDEAEFDL